MEIEEKDILNSYASLIEAIIRLNLDRITIPKRWKRKTPSLRLLKSKKKELLLEKEWLWSSKAAIWFTIYCNLKKCRKRDILTRFRRKCTNSLKYINNSIEIAESNNV